MGVIYGLERRSWSLVRGSGCDLGVWYGPTAAWVIVSDVAAELQMVQLGADAHSDAEDDEAGASDEGESGDAGSESGDDERD